MRNNTIKLQNNDINHCIKCHKFLTLYVNPQIENLVKWGYICYIFRGKIDILLIITKQCYSATNSL